MIPQPAYTVARPALSLLHPLVLLVVGLVSWPAEWDAFHAVLDSIRSSRPRASERETNVLGYYESIIGTQSNKHSIDRTFDLAPRLHTHSRPDGRFGFKEADVIRYLDDDFLQFELKPLVQRTLFGQPFITNAFGMHDDPVELDKPPGTFRIAVLGASMDMGWGVRYQDTYANRLQEWLGGYAVERGSAHPRRYEVLNFAVMAYSPLQRLDTLRRKVFAFQPDLVIYSATTLDIRLTEIHLCDMLPKGVDLHYDFLKSIVSEAKVYPRYLRTNAEGQLIHKYWLKAKLEPFYWSLYDRTLGRIAAECRSEGVPLAMVIIPRVGSADSPSARAQPVARLKALANHQGIPVFDLSDTFDRFDPTTLEIASWDDHPNAMGHQRLFLALARVITNDPSLHRQVFADDALEPPHPDISTSEHGKGTTAKQDPLRFDTVDGNEKAFPVTTRGKGPALPGSRKRPGQG